MKIKIAKDGEQATGETEIDRSDNPYLYDTSGPKRQINYSRGEGVNQNMYADDDNVVIEEEERGGAHIDDEGGYRMSHKNEKFALIPGGAQKRDQSTAQESTLA